jgi:hypothetical protein
VKRAMEIGIRGTTHRRTNLPTSSLYVGLMLSVLSLGCASAYHCYSDCHVNCTYCAPPPLAYMQYSECECHATVANPYLNRVRPSQESVEKIPGPTARLILPRPN